MINCHHALSKQLETTKTTQLMISSFSKVSSPEY